MTMYVRSLVAVLETAVGELCAVSRIRRRRSQLAPFRAGFPSVPESWLREEFYWTWSDSMLGCFRGHLSDQGGDGASALRPPLELAGGNAGLNVFKEPDQRCSAGSLEASLT